MTTKQEALDYLKKVADYIVGLDQLELPIEQHTSQRGVNLIKEFEGFRNGAYRDSVGVWTIGYGHTKGVKSGDYVTEQEGEEFLKNDLIIYEDYVKKYVDVPLTQTQFDALVSFTYNLGPGNLKKSTLLRKLNAKDYKGAANEFPRWNRAGGRVLRGLTRRREAEKQLFLS